MPPRKPAPKGDKELADRVTLMKELNYIKGKTEKYVIDCFVDSLELFRSVYKDREGSDWSQFNDWASPDHKAALFCVADEYLEWEDSGRKYWPEDETASFHNRIIFPRDEARIKPRLVEVLYRTVHPGPEDPKKGKQVRKAKTAVRSPQNANRFWGSQKAQASSGSPLRPHAPSTIHLSTIDLSTIDPSITGPSSADPPVTGPSILENNYVGSIFTARDAPLDDVSFVSSRPRDDPAEKTPDEAGAWHPITPTREALLREHLEPIMDEMMSSAQNTDDHSAMDATPPSPNLTIPLQSPVAPRRSVSVRPRAPDAPMLDVPPPAVRPTTKQPTTVQPATVQPATETHDASLPNARDPPLPGVNIAITYEVILSRPPHHEAKFWKPQGLFSTKTLAELKAELPLDFAGGTRNLSFTLVAPGSTAADGWYRWNYCIDDVDEAEFVSLKRMFQRKINHCLAKQKATNERLEPVCFEIEIELVGGPECNMSTVRSDLEFNAQW